MRPYFFVLPSLLLIVACGSSDPPTEPAPNTSSVKGAVSTASLTSISATSSEGDFFQATDGATSKGFRLLLSDKSNTCSTKHFVSSTNIDVRIRGGADPGTYPIVDANQKTPAVGEAEIDLNAVDASCKDLVASTATTGTIIIKTYEINLTSPELSHVAGSIDATFAGGHISGDFDAVLCDVDAFPNGDAGLSGSCTP